jgi:hypothetical protein
MGRLLDKNQETRLGTAAGADEIKADPWFASIDFEQLAKKQVQPPYVPVLESDGDLKHFSREFTGKSLSPADAKSLGEVRDYEGWDYADGDFEVKFD